MLTVKNADVGQMGTPGAVESLFEPKTAGQMRQNLDDFTDAVSARFQSGEGLPSPTIVKAIKGDILAILKLPGASPEEKKQLLLDKLSNKYRVDMSTLKDLGLMGEQNVS